MRSPSVPKIRLSHYGKHGAAQRLPMIFAWNVLEADSRGIVRLANKQNRLDSFHCSLDVVDLPLMLAATCPCAQSSMIGASVAELQ